MSRKMSRCDRRAIREIGRVNWTLLKTLEVKVPSAKEVRAVKQEEPRMEALAASDE